jgi:hypothetical protein
LMTIEVTPPRLFWRKHRRFRQSGAFEKFSTCFLGQGPESPAVFPGAAPLFGANTDPPESLGVASG